MTPSFLDNSLGFNIYRADLLFKKEFLHALADYGLTPEQWSVLSILLNEEVPLCQNDIVRASLKDKPSVSRIIQRLEREGWIIKTSDTDDARMAKISVTKKGKDLRDEIPRKLTKHFKQFLKDFSDDEMDLLLKLLKKLRNVLGDQ